MLWLKHGDRFGNQRRGMSIIGCCYWRTGEEQLIGKAKYVLQ
jgi:hypothetical protein